MQIKRKTMQVLVQVYLPSFMFVIVSWISYLVKPEVVPGRMALLVTLFLVLVTDLNLLVGDSTIELQLEPETKSK